MSLEVAKYIEIPYGGNIVITVSGVGNKTDFSCLAVNTIFDLGLLGGTQGFPFYLYNGNQEFLPEQLELGAMTA